MAEEIVYGYCDRCDKRGQVKEIQLRTGKVNRFCEACLKMAYEGFGAKTRTPREAEGDKPHQPYRYTQVD